MQQLSREFTVLKDEVIETRKQWDKTEGQLRNLVDTFKGFESRFENLERRGRASRFGTHLLAAAVVAGATYWVASAQMRVLRQDVEETTRAATAEKSEAQHKATELSSRLAELRAAEQSRQSARAIAAELILHLDAKRDEDAVALLDKLDFEHLDPLARDLLTTRVASFRAQVFDEAFAWGRELINRSRRRDAIDALVKAVTIWPTSPNANAARYLLANSLRESRRFDEAVKIFADIRKYETDKSVLDESLYYEGFCQAQLGNLEEASRIFQQIAASGGRYSSSARTQLAGLTDSVAASAANSHTADDGTENR